MTHEVTKAELLQYIKTMHRDLVRQLENMRKNLSTELVFSFDQNASKKTDSAVQLYM